MIKLIESEPIDVVWGCNNTAVQVLRWAKKKGIPCVLDQTTGHRVIQNQITSAEWNCHPDFFSGGFKPISNDVIDQQNEEMELADIVAVGSEFCAQTMIECGCPASKIRIVNYGYDEAIFPTERPKGRASTQGPIRFLFVGSINPMKGVAHLLKAFQSIPNDEASLTLVGHLRIPKSTFERYSNRVQHRYHVPRNEIVQSFLDADCLVFPSLFEGSALVLRECYGAGIGIIQSANSGDGAVSGKNGIVLDEITAEAVNDAVGSVIEEPRLLEEWKNASWELRQDRTWAVYRQNVRDLVARLS